MTSDSLTNAVRSSVVVAAVLIASCGGREPPPPADTALINTAPCDTAGARAVVERFGEQLQAVSLLAPDSTVQRQIRSVYGPYVTRGLLDVWLARPDSAPGRKASSPWPDRIAIDTVAPAGLRTCRVVGHVVYATSADAAQRTDTLRERVVLRVTRDSVWHIDHYDARGN